MTMHRWFAFLFILFSLGLAPGLGQSVRTQGLGGLLLPGPEAARYNPAYAAYPAGNYGYPEGFRLPVGLLGFLRQSANPFNYFFNKEAFFDKTNGFDLLSFYDQLTYLDSFLLNPARSPDEVVFTLLPSGISITDGQGNPLRTNFSRGTGGSAPTSLTPPPLFNIPVPLGLPGLSLDLGFFLSTDGLHITPSDTLQRALATGKVDPNTEYSLTGSGNAQAGISLGMAYATALPPLPGLEGQLYGGVRGEGFYGLGYAEATATAKARTDNQGQFDSNATSYTTKLFYSYVGNGTGFGVRADVGLALDYPLVGTGQDAALLTVGLGVRNLVGFSRWQGSEVTQDSSGASSPPQPATRSSGGFSPAFYLNGAYKSPLEMGSLLVGADLLWEGAPSGHLGLEYGFGPARLRGGIGYQGGLVFGIGGGWKAEGFSLDTALTTHPAPFFGGWVYGLALSLGFSF